MHVIDVELVISLFMGYWNEMSKGKSNRISNQLAGFCAAWHWHGNARYMSTAKLEQLYEL